MVISSLVVEQHVNKLYVIISQQTVDKQKRLKNMRNDSLIFNSIFCDTLNAVLPPKSYGHHLSKPQGWHIWYIYYIELYRPLYQLLGEVVFLFFSSNFVYSVCMSILLALSLSMSLSNCCHISWNLQLFISFQYLHAAISVCVCVLIVVCVSVCVHVCVFAVWNGKLQTGILYKKRQQNFDRNFGFKASFVAP